LTTPALVHLHRPGAPRATAGHALLARQFRVVPVESGADAAAVVKAIDALGLDTFNLIATSDTAVVALAVAALVPSRVPALVLEAPPPLAAGACPETPTLVVVGTADAVVPPATERTYTERLPNAHLVFVYDAGHDVSADRPEAFAEVVIDFLERREAFVINRSQTVIHP